MKIKILIIILLVFVVAIPVVMMQVDKSKETVKETAPVSFALKTVHEGEGVRLTWNNPNEAASFDVYRSYKDDEDGERIGQSEETTLFDEKVKSGEKAYYRVDACDKNGTVVDSCSGSDTLFRVCLETGHGIDENGAWDTGCTWNGKEEAKVVVPIARATADYLKKSGVFVYTDAYTENESNLFAMLDYLDTHDINAFVNIHCDYEYADSGILALYNTDAQKELAKCLSEGVHSTVDISDRGLQYRNDLETLCNSKVHCPSCLLELGCISSDYDLLTTKADYLGKGVAKGLCNYLGVKFVE